MSLFDPDDDYMWMNQSPAPYSKRGNGVIAVTADEPMAFVEARGDHDLIYVSKNLYNHDATRLAKSIVEALFKFSYTSGVFVNERRLCRPRGTLPLEHIRWGMSAAARVPDIVVTLVRATRDGLRTEVHLQSVGSTMYFDAAGGSGWTVGIALRPAPLEWRP